MKKKEELINYFNDFASEREKWNKKNYFYHKLLNRYYSFLIPEGSRVLELGCGTGDLLNSVKPEYGVGIDFSESMLRIAEKKYPQYKFIAVDAEDFDLDEKFDYVILSDLIGFLYDVQTAFKYIRKVCHENTKVIISSYNYLWEPFLKFAEFLGLKHRQPEENWFSMKDIKGLLDLEGFETVKTDRKIMMPINIPLLNFLFNNIISNLPVLNHLCLSNFIVARKQPEEKREYSVSILIPARNEKGNIENAILRIPEFGKSQEIIFIEGNSCDGTFDEILRIKGKYDEKNIIAERQTGSGKGNAVREGFDKAGGEVLMILDADLTTPPEDLPKFYEAIKNNRGEFVNGCRLVYPMEKQAMRFLNLLANKFFGLFFTFLLGQKVKDTLCGTKVLLKSNYEKIKSNRKYFGEFDPFGDFDLLFGAAKLNLKIIEVPVRYRDREYGSTQISRFRHGWLLIRMSFFAAKKIKFF
ncbi:MAG: glycosyltransferase [Ignavibacteriae bacterium]|nr:glycosyltransferase [Ignavibacteriota bacterium]